MNADIVILGADVGAGRRQDIRVRLDASSGGTTVAEVADSLNPAGAQVIDADGCAVIPAFSDHHLHLAALARAPVSPSVAVRRWSPTVRPWPTPSRTPPRPPRAGCGAWVTPNRLPVS
ncbi:hypothetical protein [Gordonia bronchialis]|uniref:hypothetical protein n=1 Tax=Gordonia bronchialis TaxID=2054 RepID=UPI00226F4DAB|nr:hypothetical protein [Gordonia bronchialis]